MNTTEERLHDALRAAGETVESVPAFVVPARRFPLSRLVACASVAALVVGGVAFWSGSGDKGPQSSPALGSPAQKTSDIDVFLCISKSSNRLCAHRNATDAEREQIKKTLASLPHVEAFAYEDQTMAWRRFNQAFSATPGFMAGTRIGDIPDSFRVLLKDPDDATQVVQILKGMPGVDQVVDENRLPDRP